MDVVHFPLRFLAKSASHPQVLAKSDAPPITYPVHGSDFWVVPLYKQTTYTMTSQHIGNFVISIILALFNGDIYNLTFI